MSRSDEGFNKYSESAYSKDGQKIGHYSTGDKGSIHSTTTHYGKGYTTLHQDGSSHHHGDHAHVAGGNSSFTRNGSYSKK